VTESVQDLVTVMDDVTAAISSVIDGKTEQIETALVTLLAGGHLLLEDVPGVGKTMLARALGRSIDCTVHRMQFTPDLLPADITGVSVFNQQTREFEFKPGGIFANVVVADEINRASPKTQSALLEAMAERQVSADGVTHELRRPFMVVATQNPIEMEGTYPLPEAQRDRFMTRITMGYPSRDSELEMLERHGAHNPLDELYPVTHGERITKLIDVVGSVYVADVVKDYLVNIVAATRSHDAVRLGASPRASLHLIRTARAKAALAGRDYVIPDDVQAMAIPVLAHRLLPSTRAQLDGISPVDIVSQILTSTPVPEQA